MIAAALPADLRGCFASDGWLHADLDGLEAGDVDLSIPAAVFLPALTPAPATHRASTPVPHTAQTPGSGALVPADAPTLDLDAVTADDRLLPKIGDVIDKYRIEEELGRGGFAAVYRATHLLMQTQVAIKLLFPWTLVQHPHLAEKLCEEARFTSLIDHQNVVRVSDVTNTTTHTYIVMEFIDGPSLAKAIARKPLSVSNVIKIGIHLCNGLEAAKEQGLIHRDIKPQNILISRSGHTKLVDFGLARRADTGDESGGRIAGTPAYIAPEQVTRPNEVDFRCDIYSLGATLFHAVTGRPPFLADEPMALIRAHLHQEPPDPATLLPTLPANLATLLVRMMAKDPAARPAGYPEIVERLLTMHRQTQVMSPVPQPEESSTRAFFSRVRNLFNHPTAPGGS